MAKLNTNMTTPYNIFIVVIIIICLYTIINKDSYGRRVYHFYNKYHYGDHILNLKFLFNISHIMKKRNSIVYYYYDPNYIKNVDELERYINRHTVILIDIKYKPDNAIEFWMGDTNKMGIHPREMASYMNKLYKNMLIELKLDNLGIDTSLYQQEDYLQDIYNNLNDMFKNLDILIINAQPQSKQLVYNKSKFDAICNRLSYKYKVATTTFVNDNIPCTFKEGLKIQDIGAISTHAKYIIAVHSGPLIACFNSASKKNVKKWILFANNGVVNREINSVTLKDIDSFTLSLLD